MAKSTVKTSSVSASRPGAVKKPANTRTPVPAEESSVKRRKVAFRLSAPHARKAAVAGTFNGWQPQPLKAASKDGLFSLTMLLTPGQYEYRFVVDGEWCSDTSCPESVPNPFGACNSLVRVA